MNEILKISMTMNQTIGMAVLLLLIGRWLRGKVGFFQKFAIPSPVIGGFLFAIINLILKTSNIVEFEFDTTLQSFFMIIFFTSIGYNASIATLKAGGPMVLKFLIIATVLCVLQNAVAVLLAGVVGVEPGLALMTGSTPMTGGHGTSAAIAPLIEDAGIARAQTVAVASATFGLVAGSLMGGPLGNSLILKYNLLEKKRNEKDFEINEDLIHNEVKPLNEWNFILGFACILIVMFFGSYISDALNSIIRNYTEKVSLPAYIGPMMIAIIVRAISDGGKDFLPNEEIQIAGAVGLNFFLAMALMTLKLWELAELALPLFALLAAQTVLMYIFSRFVTFPLMGKNYDAAVISAGHCGFGMGATPNGVANMESVCEKFTYSKMAFFVLPIVGGMFIDFTNLLVITAFVSVI